MVFFICNACGESIKKNQVDKHCNTKCRNCQFLSCVDCGKDFWGDDYQMHIKCISEDQKYGGKDYKPKANANKGERKQEEWFEQVQAAIEKCSDWKLKKWLEMLKGYPNVPRKQNKFQNFLKSSLRVPFNFHGPMWDAISSEFNKPKPTANNNQPSNQIQPNTNGTTNNTSNVHSHTNGVTSDNKENESENKNESESKNESETKSESDTKKTLSKRERKEERRKARHKSEKKDKQSGEEEQEGSRKKKKRKRSDEDDEEEQDGEEKNTEHATEPKKKKKKKSKENGDESEPVRKKMKQDTSTGEEEAEAETAPAQIKFKWENVIIHLLKKQDDKELSIKKLRKKVLSEYFACHGGDSVTHDDEKLQSKFTKKITKNPRLKVHKDRVKLVS